jgi:hypothetical protein
MAAPPNPADHRGGDAAQSPDGGDGELLPARRGHFTDAAEALCPRAAAYRAATRTEEELAKSELIWNGAKITITDEQMTEGCRQDGCVGLSASRKKS